MSTAAIVPSTFLKSKLKAWVERRVSSVGQKIRWFDSSEHAKDYGAILSDYQSVIAWNCRMPQTWVKATGRNVLYVDNSLINQKSGVFIDHRGFFSQSNLCVRQSWRKSSCANLEFIAQRDFGWSAFSGGSKEGPILVALQLRDDCNLKTEFPLSGHSADKVVESLRILHDFLPMGREILIRPHPRERSNFSCDGVWREDWVMNSEGCFKDLLPRCSALVTVNSTCVSEAALLGVPTATLGVGAFSGAGVTLDCSKDARNLEYLSGFEPDLSACRRYCAAIINHHFLPYDIAPGRVVSEFESWLAHAA